MLINSQESFENLKNDKSNIGRNYVTIISQVIQISSNKNLT